MSNNKVNTRAQRELELDAEIAELEKIETEVIENEEDIETKPSVNVEDESWKKRYSDLRSHAAKRENELTQRLAALERQVQETANTSTLPKVADRTAIREWMNEFPDVASIVLGIVEERAEARETKLNTKLEALEQDRHELAKERAFAKVCQAHEDFPKLITTPEFISWVEAHGEAGRAGDQISEAIFKALWENETDAQAAIRAVNLYKSEKKTNKRTSKDDAADAVSSVARSAPSAPTVQSNKPIFKESQIEKMSHREWDKFEEAIEEARRDGRIIYDISGAAR